jgi:hypothetical protein
MADTERDIDWLARINLHAYCDQIAYLTTCTHADGYWHWDTDAGADDHADECALPVRRLQDHGQDRQAKLVHQRDH